jgi:competence protein ComEA
MPCGKEVPATKAATTGTEVSPIDLNTATAAELTTLPGIGQKRAERILALRERLGRFRSVDDLLRARGLGRSLVKRLRPLVRVGPAGPG